ncbi:MAG: hypothetical protein QOE90_3583 [Thermoplasmata archaeon]|jgi:hypothetical protein|nr:hypothetical protein [Thermoplasmata archaeon]
MRVTLLVVSAALLLPLAAAQHEGMMGGEGMAMVLHDGPNSGRAVVGSVTHFGFALLDKDGAPTPHQNAAFLVTLDNVTTFQTNDTHEYDGLFSLDLVFAHAGHYRVEAMSGKMAMGVFEGDAVMPVNETVAKAAIKLAPAMQEGNAADVVVDVQDAAGKTIPHTDALLEWRDARTGALVSRTHAHIHEKPIQLTQAFDAPGTYDLQVTAYKAYATGTSTDVAAVLGKATFDAGPLALPNAPDPSALPPAVMEPAGATAKGKTITLYGMYDPQNQIVMGFPIRLSGLVEGADHMPKPHVDFSFTLAGPRGTVFQSSTLHEYDGHFEYLYVPQVPGAYDGMLTANDGGDKVSVPFHVQVLPPSAMASATSMGSAGLATIDVKGLDKVVAGEPTTLTFSASNQAGPIQHSEVDVTIGQAGKPALYNFKLHTHDSGDTKAVVVFPDAGDYVVRVDPLPTDIGPVVFAGPDGPGAPIVFHAKAAPGALAPASASPLTQATRPAPGFEAPALVFGAIALALLLRRK